WIESTGDMPKIKPQAIPAAIWLCPVSEFSSFRNAKICFNSNPIDPIPSFYLRYQNAIKVGLQLQRLPESPGSVSVRACPDTLEGKPPLWPNAARLRLEQCVHYSSRPAAQTLSLDNGWRLGFL